MNRDNQLHLSKKYFLPIDWYTQVLKNNLFDGNVLIEQIKSEFISITGCTVEKFNQLRKKGFMDFDYELEDQPLVETFWQIVDNISKDNE